jgi:hypothetical protein
VTSRSHHRPPHLQSLSGHLQRRPGRPSMDRNVPTRARHIYSGARLVYTRARIIYMGFPHVYIGNRAEPAACRAISQRKLGASNDAAVITVMRRCSFPVADNLESMDSVLPWSHVSPVSKEGLHRFGGFFVLSYGGTEFRGCPLHAKQIKRFANSRPPGIRGRKEWPQGQCPQMRTHPKFAGMRHKK